MLNLVIDVVFGTENGVQHISRLTRFTTEEQCIKAVAEFFQMQFNTLTGRTNLKGGKDSDRKAPPGQNAKQP